MSISASAPTAVASTQASKISMQDFLKVLLTQLTFQDPLKPMDNQQFMAQIAQFTSLEQTQEINTGLSQLLNNQASLQSVGLIGRTVDISTQSGVMTGSVTALSLGGGTPLLTVRTTSGTTLSSIELSQIVAVR